MKVENLEFLRQQTNKEVNEDQFKNGEKRFFLSLKIVFEYGSKFGSEFYRELLNSSTQ